MAISIPAFDDMDMAQLEAKGISVEEVQRQIYLFQKRSHYADLVRPCVPGDGIERFDTVDVEELAEVHDRAAREGRVTKFVPASGAATRMFRDLLHFFFLEPGDKPSLDHLRIQADNGSKKAAELLRFLESIDRFPFSEKLQEEIGDKNLGKLAKSDSYHSLVTALLSPTGLAFSDLPKALLPFHRYGRKVRTALEEHLVEAVNYARDRDNVCRLHFTVSEEHLQSFQGLLARVCDDLAGAHGVTFDLGVSVQRSSTDTLAVDLDNRPFRTERGRLLFRPGGHGSLIDNLNDLQGDIVFIKNIDNIQRDRVKAEIVSWKKSLCGCLLNLQSKIFGYLHAIRDGSADEQLLEEAYLFSRQRLHVHPADKHAPRSIDEKRTYLEGCLNRPLRVCGVVKNTGEPGGGPFWVKDNRGRTSLQIVETSQIDLSSDDQQQALANSTHFNPVDLVCGLRDLAGRPFDLFRYVDNDAVIIARKSFGGRDLKALERPGLWNGAMAGWNTIFVEVPTVTFSPVKTVNDLLRPEHQPL